MDTIFSTQHEIKGPKIMLYMNKGYPVFPYIYIYRVYTLTMYMQDRCVVTLGVGGFSESI